MASGLIGPEGRRQLKLAARFASAGIELAASVIVGYFGGRYLDEKLATDGVLTYVGLVLGICAGFLSLYRVARAAQRQASQDQQSHDNPDEQTKP